MKNSIHLLVTTALLTQLITPDASSCCAVTRDVSKVVNADQTVIILWDAAKKQQHFIRQASFKSDAKDVGFIVPSPTQPELEESGDAAFAMLKRITAPKIVRSRGVGLGCSSSSLKETKSSVEVLERKRVAGFDAVVLKAGTSAALVDWLAKNDYAYSDEVAAWADPYVKRGWPFTALKVAAKEEGDSLDASALRISFKTDTPLFPYREPDSAAAAKELGAKDRLLRIYFISDQAYAGKFETGGKWTGKVRWSGSITLERARLIKELKLPEDSVPQEWWLTEFEDNWPYAKAPGDVLFAASGNRMEIQRSAESGHDPLPALAGLLTLTFWVRRRMSTASRRRGS